MLLIVDDHTVQNVKNRRVPILHPTVAMVDGSTSIFQRKDSQRCRLTSLYFTVLKVRSGVNDFYFTFYAITGEFNVTNLTEIPNGTPKRKYVDQIGYITCTHGWIYDLTVFGRSLNPGGRTENPQRCGIGTVLTELCLIDPDIRVRNQGNLAQEHLSLFPEYPIVVKYCHNLVGLMMSANPRAGAQVYFNAAINMRYVLLLVDTSDEEDPCGKEPNQLLMYPIHVAKGYYSNGTGNILPCPAWEENCDAWGKRWYFCTDYKYSQLDYT